MYLFDKNFFSTVWRIGIIARNFMLKTDYHSDLTLAYRAAELAAKGNCAAKISKALFDGRDSQKIMRVNQLLKLAAERGIFSLKPPMNLDLEENLNFCFSKNITFHVVNNDQPPYEEGVTFDNSFRADAICRRAAEVVASRITTLLGEHRQSRKTIVIANAGGPAISRVVRFLPSYRNLPEESNAFQLLFISLNSASIPDHYDYSANTLAVRMSEIYGGRHIALSPVWPKAIGEQYSKAVRHIDLLLCGAGTNSGLLFHWLNNEVHVRLPSGAVGDLCLIPISAQGEELHLEDNGRKFVEQQLRPSPTYEDLKDLADRNGVIYVAMGQQTGDKQTHTPGTTPPPHSKLVVARTILKHGLARTCVLGATLARNLLADAYPPATPPDA